MSKIFKAYVVMKLEYGDCGETQMGIYSAHSNEYSAKRIVVALQMEDNIKSAWYEEALDVQLW